MKAIFVVLLNLPLIICSQNMLERSGNGRFIGFNTNPILSQIIPLNGNNPVLTTASLMFRTYNVYDNGIRAGYGLALGNENDFSNLFLSLDNDMRRNLNENFSYFHGFGTSLKIFSNNLNRRNTNPVQEEFTLALVYHWGVEYHFNEVVSLSTEASLRLGINLQDGMSVFKIDPPINILLHFCIN